MKTKIPDNTAPAHPPSADKGWSIVDGLVCAPAELAPGPWLSYGFTTRDAGDFLTEEAVQHLLERLAGEGGGQYGNATELKLLRQVHGTALLSPEVVGEGQRGLSGSALLGGNALPEGDGWVGKPPAGVLLGVRTADCLPLLLWSDETQSVAVVHAGWRGAVAGTCAKALRELKCAPENVRALIGPCIGPCCFEVGGEVAEEFGEDARWLAPSPKGVAGKYHLDLPRYVTEELVAAGMKRAAIAGAPYCTLCDARFFSHRGGDIGRLCSFAARR